MNQFFLLFFGSLGVIFPGLAALHGASIWDKKVKADIEDPTAVRSDD